MHPFDEMKAYAGFGHEDSERLRAMLPVLDGRLASVSERFYDHLLRFAGSAEVVNGPAQVARLKRSLEGWMRNLLSGPHDHAYYERGLHIGRVHVRVGLPQRYMFTAMTRLREDMLAAWEEETGAPCPPASVASLAKLCDLELSVMLSAYVETQQVVRLEALRDLLVRHLPMHAALLDAEGRVTAATGTMRREFIDRRAAEITGHHYTDVLDPALVEAADVGARIERALRSGNEVVVPRVDLPINGRTASFQVCVVPIEHDLARTLIYVEDMTDAIASETRARQHENLAQLGTLAAAVAHEIRNPLAGISGTMQVILNTLPATDKRRGVIGKVLEQIGRLSSMVNDLLTFSKPVSAECRTADLRRVGLRVASQAAASELGDTTVLGEGSGYADEGLLGSALFNLVQNAWQAGATRVELRVANDAVDVVDDGPGIDEDAAERIFQPFFTTRLRGTGLGLPNSARAVEAMGGQLTLSTSPLGGAGFSIRLAARPYRA